MSRASRLATVALCWALTAATPPLHAQTGAGPAAGADPDEPLEDAPSDESYDEFLETLQGLSLEAQIEAIGEYLELNPDSPHRAELEERRTTLRHIAGEIQRARQRQVHLGLDEPLSFPAPDPGRRASALLSLGGPAWFEALAGYDQPVTTRISVGGRLGVSERVGLLEGVGRYALFQNPLLRESLSVGLALRIELGDDTRLQIEPRFGYRRRLGPVDLQAYLAPRVRLNGLDVRYQLGTGGSLPIGRRWRVNLETTGYLKRVLAVRTDLGTTDPTLVSFFAATAGARFQLNPRLSLMAALSVPYWYRFEEDYRFAVSVGVLYRLEKGG